jgi:hypothetical protein
MAFLPMTGSEYPNLVNVTKRLDPNGKVAKIAELLTQYNPVLEDVPLIEANLPTGHRSTVRSDLPTPTWRRLNYGTKPTKSKTVQVDDTIGMLEDYAEVDKELANLNGNSADFRLSEDAPHLEAMAQEMATTLFYGDTAVNPDRFLGLAPRYDALDLTGTKPAAQIQSSQLNHVVDMGGSANLTSLFLVSWGQNTVHGIFPKGSKQGIHHADLGEQTLYDDDGGRFQGYRTHYQWKMGMVVRDWRFIVRIANIDVSTIDTEANQIALYKAMIKAMHTIPQGGAGHTMFYSGAAVAAMLDIAATQKGNAALGLMDVFGKQMNSFRNIPIRQCHAIIEDEAEVV